MENYDWINERIRNLFINIKAEIILADLLEAGIDPEKIVIAPVGTAKRSYRNDLIDSQWIELKSGKKLFYLFVTREGIYDSLPEGIFHQPILTDPNSSPVSMTDTVKREKKEEQDARTFFLPFEQEIYYQRIAVEKEERKLLSELKENSSDLFVNFWKMDDCLNATQKAILLNILPMSHKIVGDNELTSQCFEMVLGTKVVVRPIEPIVKSVYIKDVAEVGNSILGVNMVLGNTFYDGEPAIEIAIGPLKEDKLTDFIPGGAGYEVFDLLCNYFIPVELDISTKIVIDESTFDSQFDSKKETMRLGYNVCLTNNNKSKLKHSFA